MARLAGWEASSSSSPALLFADHEAEQQLLLQPERQLQDSAPLSVAGGVSLLHVRRRRKKDHHEYFNHLILRSQLISAAVTALVFLVLRCMDSFGGIRINAFPSSRRLAVGGEDPCGAGSEVPQVAQHEEAPLDLETRASLLLQQLSLSAADAAALTQKELSEVKAAETRLAKLQQEFADRVRNVRISQEQLAKQDMWLQQAISLSALGCAKPRCLRSRLAELRRERERHKERLEQLQRVTAALRSVAAAPEQLVRFACIHANSYASNRGLSPAAAAALAAADIVNKEGPRSSGASLAILTSAARAALPFVLRPLQRKAEGLCRQLWLARFDEETEEDGLRVLQQARVFIEQTRELESGWAEAGFEPWPALFAEAVERLKAEEKRLPSKAQQRKEQPQSRPHSPAALPLPSASDSAAAAADLEAQALHQLLLLSPQVSANLSEEDIQRIDEARQRLAELLQLSNQKKVLQARINNALIHAAKSRGKSSLQTSEGGSSDAQAAQSPERQDPFYEAWLEETGREFEAAQSRLQAVAFHPQQEAFALLQQVQRQLEGSDPITFDEARALVAAEVVQDSLKPLIPAPPPTESQRQAIFDFLSEKTKLLEGLSALETEALVAEVQVAVEGVVDEAETLAAAGRLLLGPQDAAVGDLEARAAALRKHLQDAREELDEAAKREAMRQWIKEQKVEVAAIPRVLELGWSPRGRWRGGPMQLEALILERARALEEGRIHAECCASASPEEKTQVAEVLRLTEMQVKELESRMNSYWAWHCKELTTQLEKVVAKSRKARRHLVSAPLSEALSLDPHEAQRQQLEQQQSGQQQQQSRRQLIKQAAALRATVKLLTTQRAVEEELGALQRLAEVRPLSADIAAAVQQLKLVLGQVNEEAATGVASVVSPLETHLAALMERLAQLDASVKHRLAGLARARMLLRFGIDSHNQYGPSLQKKMQCEDEIKLLLRRSEALLDHLRAAGAPAEGLQGLASVVEQTKNYGVFPP
ncbi:hypothetical protein ACSSS7_004502 [Eimeria intestinalis]